MSRQIGFFLCDAMQAAIQSEAQRIGAKMVATYTSDGNSIQFSRPYGDDDRRGRLWTDSQDPAHYELLRRAVKKDADFDRDTGLWFKRVSRAQYQAYKSEEKKRLDEVVEANRKYAREVLGAVIRKPTG